MFLLGMQQTFGTNGFDIIEMPNASPVSVENFSEFKDLFSAISETRTYVIQVNDEIKKSTLPVVFVEGDYDVKYLKKTMDLFFKDENLSSKFRLLDSDGFGNLDKIWKSMDSKIVDVLTARTLLLYDCDISKSDSKKGKITRKTIPTVDTNPIKKGIENLLPQTTIEKLEVSNQNYIDVVPEYIQRTRGQDIVVPSVKSVNKDEKKNICEWLCANGTTDDFEGFKAVIEIIKDFINER